MYNLWTNQSLKINIADNMERYGGSFVQALSKCIMRADRDNLRKLEVAFEDYIEKYHPKNWGN